MLSHLIRRLLLITASLLIVLTINFFLIHIAPSEPIDYTATVLPSSNRYHNSAAAYSGNQGLDLHTTEQIKKQYDFDKPRWPRYLDTINNYLHFNFGYSLFNGNAVIQLIAQHLSMSVSLSIWGTLLVYVISIPIGIRKAIKHGSQFDLSSSILIIVNYMVVACLFAIFIMILFASGYYYDFFPLYDIFSHVLSLFDHLNNHVYQIIVPIIAAAIGGFSQLTLLNKNSFLNSIQKHYAVTVKIKQLNENKMRCHSVFKHAISLITLGFPSVFINLLFTVTVLIEIAFSLNGIGLLGYEAILRHDYPIIFAIVYIFTLIGLLMTTINDVMHKLIDLPLRFEDTLR